MTAIGDPLVCVPFGKNLDDGHGELEANNNPKYAGKRFIALTLAFPKTVQPDQGHLLVKHGM